MINVFSYFFCLPGALFLLVSWLQLLNHISRIVSMREINRVQWIAFIESFMKWDMKSKFSSCFLLLLERISESSVKLSAAPESSHCKQFKDQRVSLTFVVGFSEALSFPHESQDLQHQLQLMRCCHGYWNFIFEWCNLFSLSWTRKVSCFEGEGMKTLD